jgi:hypothetical protein
LSFFNCGPVSGLVLRGRKRRERERATATDRERERERERRTEREREAEIQTYRQTDRQTDREREGRRERERERERERDGQTDRRREERETGGLEFKVRGLGSGVQGSGLWHKSAGCQGLKGTASSLASSRLIIRACSTNRDSNSRFQI